MQIRVVKKEYQKIEDELLELSNLLTGDDIDITTELSSLTQDEKDQLFSDLVMVCRYIVQKVKYKGQ